MVQTSTKLDIGRLVVLRDQDNQSPVMGRIIGKMYDQVFLDGPKFAVYCVEFPDGRVTKEYQENIKPFYLTKQKLKQCGFPCLVSSASAKVSLWDAYVKKYATRKE